MLKNLLIIIKKNFVNELMKINIFADTICGWCFIGHRNLNNALKKFPNTKFRYINRREYLDGNHFLKHYFDLPNIKVGIYADLRRWVEGERDKIKWTIL